MLREGDAGFVANHATLVVTGWTARTSLASYRNYVREIVDATSPAHVLVDILWLDQAQMARFETLRDCVETQGGKAALRAFLQDPDGAE